MRYHPVMISALALALAVPAVSLAQGRGQGQGENASAHGGQHENGNGNARGNAGREQGPADRGADVARGQGRGQGQADRPANPARGPDRAEPAQVGIERANPGRGQGQGQGQGAGRGNDDRAPAIVARRAPPGLIDGCPPGLAWRNNGCLPPGQARQLDRADQSDWFWNRWGEDGRYRYVDGYLYQTRSDGGLAGWIPLLGGALGINNVWPQTYQYQPVPSYQTRYYRLGDRYDYRYANGVVYGVDPQTQAIQQVAALLTGQSWNVGQPMPRGYDAYNVPYAYREQYKDTSQSWYRYNDGYVYQVDPTTRLVQAVIQLLT